MDERKDNDYVKELKKFIGKDVVVKNSLGETFKGVCKVINFMHLNVILKTKEEKIILKNISHITRKRTKQKKR